MYKRTFKHLSSIHYIQEVIRSMDNWIPLTEIEKLTGIKPSTFRNYIKRGQVIPKDKYVKFGNIWAIDKEWFYEKYEDKIKEDK